MRVSVVMSVFNNAPFLDVAVESILAQTMGDFEFIIVDDGSTDGSTEILRRHAAADARIRLIEQTNHGLIFSLNRAISEARTPWIARMDGDDLAMPDRFAQQLAFLKAHPEYGVVGCQMMLIDEAGRTIRPAPAYPRTNEAFRDAMEERPLMSHPAVIMARTLLLDAGGYRAGFHYCEDYDLWLRLSERTSLCSLDAVLMHHRFNPNQVSSKYLLEQKIGAAVAWEAHVDRMAGRADPTDGLDTMPLVADLDRVFARHGVTRIVRAKVARAILHSMPALIGGGVQLLVDHAADDAKRQPLWRVVLRLMRHGRVVEAGQLAVGILRSYRRSPSA